MTDLTSHRIPVTSYVAPDLDDLVNYTRLLSPGRHYVLQNLHGESLLFCSTCRWTFQNYITETCDQCKAPIQWNCAAKELSSYSLIYPA